MLMTLVMEEGVLVEIVLPTCVGEQNMAVAYCLARSSGLDPMAVEAKQRGVWWVFGRADRQASAKAKRANLVFAKL